MLLLALAITAATAAACGGGGATATSLSTSLSGEKSGEEITVTEGSGVKDTATLSGTNASKAGGTVKYAVYKDKACKELVTNAGEFSVKEGKIPASEEKKLEAGSVYYWLAVYSGDGNNSASTSTCGKEVLTVKATTSLSTSLSGGGKEGEAITVTEGSGVKDTATLSGTKASTATGSVKYALYSDKECKELLSNAGEGALKEGKAGASEEKKPEAGAVYYWLAKYEGDGLHEKSASACGKEVLTVKATTSLSTSLAGDGKEGEKITVSEGSKVKDTATLSGTKASTATGTVSYAVYKDKECKELATKAGEGKVEGTKVAGSEEKELEAGAVYYWLATYEGDGLHEKSTSTCSKEVLTVMAAMSLKTSLSGEEQTGEEIEVQESAGVTDSATLSGTNVAGAGGTVEYFVYADEKCEELVTEAGKAVVEGAAVPASAETKLKAGAIYHWLAVYSGDATHEGISGVCGEELEIVAAPTSLTTSFVGAEEPSEKLQVPSGTAVSDSATLSGANVEKAKGFIGYNVYSDSECKELVMAAGAANVEGESVPASNTVVLPTGTYYWQARFYGDLLNKASTSACGSEVLTVEEQPLTTVLSGEGEEGTELQVEEEAVVMDAATLNTAHAATATGTIEYKVYSDEECTEFVTGAGTAEVEGGNVPPSTELKLPGGIYYWQAVYSGDEENPASTSVCGDEILFVGDETILTASLTAGKESGKKVTVREGDAVTGTATLSGANASKATGSAQYFLFKDKECEELVTKAGEVEVKGESLPASTEVTELPVGEYFWLVVYEGDSANQGSESECGEDVETVTVAAVTAELASGGKEDEELEVEEKAGVTDTAILHIANAGTATGTVEYNVYSDPKCKELAVKAGKVTIEKGVIPKSEAVELGEGVYYWQASYSGDVEHESASSVCGAQVQRVQPGPTPWIVSVGDSFISGEGGRWAGNLLGVQGPLNRLGINALGSTAYKDLGNAEAIADCRRSRSAEVHIGFSDVAQGRGRVFSRNLACSGSFTQSLAGVFPVRRQEVFKPGLDFLNVGPGEPIDPMNAALGRCPRPPLTPLAQDGPGRCKGQALLLQEFAAERRFNNEPVRLVVISIGGNDFEFSPTLVECVAASYTPSSECHLNPGTRSRFEEPALKLRREAIEVAIGRTAIAMVNAGFQANEFTLLVQDYPSPLPLSNEFRFHNSVTRNQPGRCPIKDGDVNWANLSALAEMNTTVRAAASSLDGQMINGRPLDVKYMEIENAFQGRRLCEEGLGLIGPAAAATGGFLSWQSDGAVDGAEWVNQLRFWTVLTPFSWVEDLHPNYWGQLALRNCLRKRFNDLAPTERKCVIEGPGLEPRPPGQANLNWMREPKMALSP